MMILMKMKTEEESDASLFVDQRARNRAFIWFKLEVGFELDHCNDSDKIVSLMQEL